MAGRGRTKTGGRKKGTPNKVTAAVSEAILKAFEQVGGEDYLVQVAQRDPKTFCTLLGKLVPAQVKAEVESSGEPVVVIRDFTGGFDRDARQGQAGE